MTKLSKSFTLILLLVLFFGCQREYFEIDRFAGGAYDGEFAVPILKANLTMYDLLEQDTGSFDILTDDGGDFLSLTYSDSAESISANEFFSLPGFTESESYSLSAGEIVVFQNVGTIDVTEQIDISFDPGASIDFVDFKSGQMVFDLSSDFRHQGQVTFTFPDIVKDGNPMEAILQFDGRNGNAPDSDSESIDLNGYTLGLNGGNTVAADVRIEMTNSGEGTVPSDEITLSISLNNPEYSLIQGDFGNAEIEIPTSKTQLNIFANFNGGTFTLTNPTIITNLYNSFGVPFELTIDSFYTEKVSKPATKRFIVGPGVDEAKAIAGATNVGDVAESSFFLNNSNTEFAGSVPPGADPDRPMSYVIEPTPKYVVNAFTVTANPDGPATNFLTDKSKIDVVTEVLLPLRGYATVTLEDTVEYELFSEEDISNLNSVTIRTIIDNGFPLEGVMQARIMNYDAATNSYSELFSLFPAGGEAIIEGAPTGADARAIGTVQKITDINVEGENILNLARGNRMIISATLQSTDYASKNEVKIYTDYELDLRLGVKAKGNVGF